MADGGRVDLDRPWAWTLPARVVREFSICGVFDAIVRSYASVEVSGREQLARLDGPAIFVANHSSHVDTPVLLRALPARWRRRTAVTAAADYFYSSRLLGSAVSLAFGTVPLERRGGGGTRPTAGLGPLIEAGWSLVVFPTGTRSRDGSVGRLRPGAAILAAQHRLPIVPVHITGTRAAMPVGSGWMSRPPGGGRLARHKIGLTFGAPIAVAPDDDPRAVMEKVRHFLATQGEETTPDPAPAPEHVPVTATTTPRLAERGGA
jgi:1-acyl-sn-glycerol-3-phosphate acyltransferase